MRREAAVDSRAWRRRRPQRARLTAAVAALALVGSMAAARSNVAHHLSDLMAGITAKPRLPVPLLSTDASGAPGPTLSIIAGVNGTVGPPRPGAATLSPLDLDYPASGVAVDGAGNLYIADPLNNVVERVSAVDGTLSIAASGLNHPTGAAVDEAGNLFIADYLDHRVVKVTPAGVQSVVAGTGRVGTPTRGLATSSALGLPAAVALDKRNGDLYIADSAASNGGHRVEKVTSAGILSVVAGTGALGRPIPGSATASRFGDPVAVAVDPSGNLFIADSLNAMVLKVSRGVLSVVAGTGVQGMAVAGPATASPLGNPAALAVDSSGNLYIADEFDFLVEKVTGGILSIAAGVAGTHGLPTPGAATDSPLTGPVGLAADSAGNLYIAGAGSNSVWKLTFSNATAAPVVPAAAVVVPAAVVPAAVVPAAVVPPIVTPPAVAPPPRASVLIASGPVTLDGSTLVRLPSTAPSGARAVAAAATSSGQGTWVVTADGGVFTSGDARFFGSMGGLRLNQPIEGMAPTASGLGYWLVASDGGIFAFGDAGFYGSTGALRLNRPIVGMAATGSGHGYWLFAADGGIFAFGDAGFFGSTGAIKLNKPINGMASTKTGHGYWLVASDGGIFAFGDAGFQGSLGGAALSAPIEGMVPSNGGHGYRMIGNDGRVYPFGDAV